MNCWPTKPLGEFCRTGSGGTPSRSKPEYYDAGTVPWVKSGELRDSIILDTAEKISEVATRETNARPVPKNAVLVAMYGATVGKTAILGIEATTNQAVCHIIPNDQTANFRFVWYAVRSCLDQLLSKRVGGAQPNISQGIIRDTIIPVPPLTEQERIVTLLDEADELRKLRAQADHRTAALVPSLFQEMFGDPFTSPKGCSVVRIDEAGRVQLGRQRAPKYQTGKFTRPYVRVANVYEDEIDVSDLLSMDFDKRDFAQYRLEHGDILLNEGQSTELVGRPAMWRNEITDCCFQNTLVRFQPERKRVLPDFALAVFLAYFREGNFAKISSKTSNVAHLGAARFSKMPFPLPPLPQQNEFAARVSETRAVRAEQSAARRRLDDLFQSMLHRAFRGEL